MPSEIPCSLGRQMKLLVDKSETKQKMSISAVAKVGGCFTHLMLEHIHICNGLGILNFLLPLFLPYTRIIAYEFTVQMPRTPYAINLTLTEIKFEAAKTLSVCE